MPHQVPRVRGDFWRSLEELPEGVGATLSARLTRFADDSFELILGAGVGADRIQASVRLPAGTHGPQAANELQHDLESKIAALWAP